MHLGPTLADLRVSVRFLRRLPFHLRRPLSRDAAMAILRRRFERCEEDFLALVDRAVYANPSSPYRRLLALVGCEPGDLARLVKTDGIEGALAVLCRKGVYLTVDEFKGRRPLTRGSAIVPCDPAHLGNPVSALHVPTETGGSGGASRPLVYDLATIHDRAVNTLLALDGQGGGGWSKGVWGVSTGSAPVVLRFASVGVRAEARPDVALPDFPALQARWPEFFRKGRVGSWREEMSPALHELFWARHAEAMLRFGYRRDAEMS
jgi:hypothetical protein